MKYLDLLIGFFIGMITAFFGAFLYLLIFTSYNLFTNFQILIDTGILVSVLKLGALLNIIVFFVLLKFNKDNIAKGIIVSFFVLTLLSFFI